MVLATDRTIEEIQRMLVALEYIHRKAEERRDPLLVRLARRLGISIVRV